VKPIPTRRPIILSQEYIDTLNTKLTHARLSGLTGLYNILSVDITTSNALFKRAVDNKQFFDIYDQFGPKQAAEFHSGMDEAADCRCMNQSLNDAQVQTQLMPVRQHHPRRLCQFGRADDRQHRKDVDQTGAWNQQTITVPN
jgi:hypothetical protein